ncbi:hypothetical protein [Flavobacterium dankookense]|uniref:Uncharacterized protein n=1 Tax=Flavobacterium dankookense TaxID=706186 RepID=A0A4R6QE49_9FLAO|nr:hypothetical protein [Flavobacterium dankookense]TDP61144.1 hypothetical protein BC748_0757 [Flavobacterium dankookense]
MENEDVKTVSIGRRLLYANSFGIILLDSIMIFDRDKTHSVELSSIKKVFLKKYRSLYLNYFFCLGALVLLINYFVVNFFELNLWLTISLTIILFVVSVLIRKNNYMFYIITNDHSLNVIKLNVEKDKVVHSKQILRTLHKTLKNNIN